MLAWHRILRYGLSMIGKTAPPLFALKNIEETV